MFITFEGIDLSGKSTQAELLYIRLKKKNKKVIFVREPGGTVISEKIRKILLDRKNKNMLALTEFLLFSASRHQLTEEIIKPHLKKGYYVICDRYFDSSTAYQGYGGEVKPDIINRINKIAISSLNPDISFLIDVSLEETIKRRKKLRKVHDRMEAKTRIYYKKVISGYREIAKIDRKRYVVINGNKSIEEIHNNIITKIENLTIK
ncbi:MAG: dTMP kinase [Ignavibacteria bacterium]|nr:dTMP kinase [Ignavibacteria bacterium]